MYEDILNLISNAGNVNQHDTPFHIYFTDKIKESWQ